MIKLQIGGSPCTFWSIAQKGERETEPSGLGWDLFENYRIAKDKFKPDFFLYENNVSAAEPIKARIRKELNAWDGTLLMEDTGVRYDEYNSARVSAQHRERFYVHNCGDLYLPKDRGLVLRDILDMDSDGVRYKLLPPQNIPVCLNSKSGRGGVDGLQPSLSRRIYSIDGKNPAVTTGYQTKIAEPIRIGTIESDTHSQYHASKPFRVYSPDGKSVALQGNAGGVGAKTGLYACPAQMGDEGVYEVIGGETTINGKKYPIDLPDGFYIIRKPTVKECCRLQTLPDNYCRAVSPSQGYKGLGNGWTAEIIIHILNGALKDVPRDEEIVVLSMYDGIGTGRYCLDKMGFTNVRYFAYEIDKYAIKVAMSNYPDIIQMGDAFDVRHPDWTIGY